MMWCLPREPLLLKTFSSREWRFLKSYAYLVMVSVAFDRVFMLHVSPSDISAMS